MPPGPAFAEAVERASAEVAGPEIPDSLRHLVVRRLGYVPERTVATLRSASLLGEAFSLLDLTVTGRRAGELVEGLDERIKTGLLADREGLLIFRHQLVFHAIYEDIPEAPRSRLWNSGVRTPGPVDERPAEGALA